MRVFFSDSEKMERRGGIVYFPGSWRRNTPKTCFLLIDLLAQSSRGLISAPEVPLGLAALSNFSAQILLGLARLAQCLNCFSVTYTSL